MARAQSQYPAKPIPSWGAYYIPQLPREALMPSHS